MKIFEARKVVGNAVRFGLITLEEAGRRQDEISQVDGDEKGATILVADLIRRLAARRIVR